MPDGSTAELEVGWAGRFSRVTKLMEAQAIRVLEAARSHSDAADLLGMSRGQLDRIMARAVERGMSRRAGEAIPHAGVDEKAMRRGHRYVSIMTDITRGRVIDLIEGRDKEVGWKALGETHSDTTRQRRCRSHGHVDSLHVFGNDLRF